VQLFWRLNFELFGQPPVVVFQHKFGRMVGEYPDVTFDTVETKSETPAKPKTPKVKKEKAAPATGTTEQTVSA